MWGGAFGGKGQQQGEDACEGALRWGGAFGIRGQQQGRMRARVRYGGAVPSEEKVKSRGGWGKWRRALSLARWGFIGGGRGLSGASVGVFAVPSRVALSRAACAALCGDAPFRAVPARAL